MRRRARAWNQRGLKGLRPSFGGGRPPKIIPTQFDELCVILEEGQLWMPRAIHALVEDRYGVTYHPPHLNRTFWFNDMNYAKPCPIDLRRPDDAEEILAERLTQVLGENAPEVEEDPVVFGFFR